MPRQALDKKDFWAGLTEATSCEMPIIDVHEIGDLRLHSLHRRTVVLLSNPEDSFNHL
jgi:hypothetical protein